MISKLSKTQKTMQFGLLSAFITLAITAAFLGADSSDDEQKKHTNDIDRPTPPKTHAHPSHTSPNARATPRPHFKPKFKNKPTQLDLKPSNDVAAPQPNTTKKSIDTTPTSQPSQPKKVYTNKDTPHQTGPFEYKDPTNKKILGPSAWMAQPTESQRTSINRSLDNSPAKAEQEKNQRRASAFKQARQLAKAAQKRCLNTWPLEPTIKPRRVLLTMDLEQRPKFGRVRKAVILSALNIGSEDHLTCLTDTLYNARTDINIPMWITLKIPLAY